LGVALCFYTFHQQPRQWAKAICLNLSLRIAVRHEEDARCD
ncbi:putative O-methyltransferase 2, partial [Dichanthelium oligosanthes]